MGVIIYAGDDTDFKKGDFIVMHRELTSPPTAPDTTYILHCESFPLSTAKEWLPLVSYRLVIIQRKGLKGISEGNGIIIHKSAKEKKDSFMQPINTLFKFSDRNRVWNVFQSTPMPLAESFHKVNRPMDIETQRIISMARYQMEEKYARAALVFGTKGKQDRIEFPKKKEKRNDEELHGFRESDVYAEILIKHAPEIRNELRTIDKTPSTIKKTKEAVIEWL